MRFTSSPRARTSASPWNYRSGGRCGHHADKSASAGFRIDRSRCRGRRDLEAGSFQPARHPDGAGGIGKTRLALAVARRLLPQFPDGVWLAEFSPLSDPNLVPATIAAAVGLELGGGELSAQRVAQALAARRLLLVLDTCEHVIDAATTMAEAVLRTGSAVHIIATSREPLRAEGERLYRVQPLAVPAEDAKNLLDYGAVRLFVERARAAEPIWPQIGIG